MKVAPLPQTDAQLIGVLQDRVVELANENAQLKANNKTLQGNEDRHAKNAQHYKDRIVELQERLLHSQDRVCELQHKLLAVRTAAM